MEIASNRLKDIASYFREKLDLFYESSEIEEFIVISFEFYLGIKRHELINRQNDRVNQSDLLKLNFVVKQLKQHKPIQYILGEAWFYGMKLKVNPNVLIPRPETEELVDWIASDHKNKKSLDVLDLCTGSGCIALGLAKVFSDANVSAIDISVDAIQVAKENAKLNNLKVDFSCANVLALNLADHGLYDIMVSNPPYVRKVEACTMKQNVLEHEPHLALFVEDDDALVFYKAIADFAKQKLKPGGTLYLEINEALAVETKTLLTQIGFKNIELKKDLQGKWRMLKGWGND